MATTRTPEQEAARKKLLDTGKYETYINSAGNEDIRLKPSYQTATATTQQPAVQPVATKSTTDMLLESLIGKLTQQNQNKVDFNNYLSNWKPDMSQQQYVDTAVNAATAAQNTAYDNSVAAIRQRVANILSGLNTQMASLPEKYRGAYEQNNQNAYDQAEAIKQIMARRGLLTSGVDVGNQKQTQNTYNAAEQGITAQMNADKTDLMNQINQANTNAEMDISAAEQARQNAIAEAQSQAVREYIDYVNSQKQFAADNYWRGAEYDLNSQKIYNDLLGMAANYSLGRQELSEDARQFNESLRENARQFAESQGLEYDRLSQQDKQFYDNLAQEQKQFESKMEQDSKQFAASMGYNYARLKEDGRQFDARLGYDTEALAQEFQLATAQMTNSLAIARLGNGYKEDGSGLSEKWNEEYKMWKADYELELKSFDTSKQAYYTQEADRVSSGVASLMGQFEAALKNKNDTASAGRIGNQIVSLIKTSGMPESAKIEYYKTIINAANSAGVKIRMPLTMSEMNRFKD